MTELRIGSILAAAAVLYLALEGLRAEIAPSPATILAFVVALLVLLSGRSTHSALAADEVGSRRVAALFPLSAVWLGARIPHLPTLASLAVGTAAASGIGAVLLDLALDVPEPSRPNRRARAAALTVTVTLGFLGVVAALGAAGSSLVPALPGALARALAALLPATAGAALFVRALRERSAPSATSLAAHAWGLLGLVPATVAFGVTAVGSGPLGGQAQGRLVAVLLAALGVASTLFGHVAMIDASRRIEAASTSRTALEWTTALIAASALGALAAPYVPRNPVASGVLLVIGIAVTVLVRTLARPLVRRLVAPFGGRLLDAIADAEQGALAATTLAELAAAVLGPLRTAASTSEAEPRLHLVDPELAFRIDAAGIAREKREAISVLLLRRVADTREPLVLADLDAQVVRKPEARPLHEALVAVDALVVLPVVCSEGVDALLVVARGARRTAPSLEELAALERLARRIAPFVALASTHARAETRIGRLSFEKDRAEEVAEEARDEAARLRAELRALRSGRGAAESETVVAYAAASRDFERALSDVSPTHTPVTLVAEPGMHVDRVARRIHEASGVSEGPFVLADCSSIREDAAEAAFFGVEGDASKPGYLRLADHGTLLLADVVALPLGVQRALAEALAARGGRAVGSHAIFGFDVRVVATARLPVESLVSSGSLDADLGRRIAQVEIRVPPLRERPEDIPSLALLAVDRAVRRLGRSPLGLDQTALEALLAHPFPGNLRELESVLERAAERAPGSTVDAALLAEAFGSPSLVPEEDLTGSLVEIERRALRRALDRAAGNKSEAARALGIARTTFLDKLRRFGLEDGSSVPPPRPEG